MSLWEKSILEQLELIQHNNRHYEQVFEDYNEILCRLEQLNKEQKVLTNQNKLMKFELINFDMEKLHNLEQENETLKGKLHRKDMTHSMPNLLPDNVSALQKELQAANDQNHHLKQLLVSERDSRKNSVTPISEELDPQHKSMLEKELLAANAQNERLKKLLLEERSKKK